MMFLSPFKFVYVNIQLYCLLNWNENYHLKDTTFNYNVLIAYLIHVFFLFRGCFPFLVDRIYVWKNEEYNLWNYIYLMTQESPIYQHLLMSYDLPYCGKDCDSVDLS